MADSIIIVGAFASAAVATVMGIAVLIKLVGARRLAHGTIPISVLKPLKGVDDDLEENLESFCRQTHGTYELIVGAADADDPALVVAERVRQRFPNVRIRVVAGQWPTGHNPKIRNLRNLLTKARYPAILVSDGDIRVDANYLSVMAGALERGNLGLVSNLVIGTGERSIGAACENLRLNGFIAGSIAAAELIARHPIVIGKSMLFSREALSAAGGLEAASEVLAEDYLLGQAVRKAGYRVSTLGFPIWAVNRDWSLLKMMQRHTRWSQIRRNVSPGTYLLEPLAMPELWLIALMSRLLEPGRTLAAADVAAVISVVLALLLQMTATLRLRRPALKLRLLALPLSSALAFVAWLRAWNLDRVVWRNQAYRIGPGSRLSPIRARTSAAAHDVRMPEAA